MLTPFYQIQILLAGRCQQLLHYLKVTSPYGVEWLDLDDIYCLTEHEKE